MTRNVIKNTDRSLLDFTYSADSDTVSEFISIMSDRYDFLSVVTIGESILGKPIRMVTLGDENAEKEILYVAAHHGTEWITSLILLRFINEYCEYYKATKQVFGINIGTLFATRCIHIVPQLNPDGADIQINGIDNSNPLYDRLMKISGGDFSHWNANARGVDLNHNFNAGFEEYKSLELNNSITAGATRFSGESPESEPETGAICNYLRFNEKIKMIMSFHSQGEVIYYTSGKNTPESSPKIARKLSKMSGYDVEVPTGLASYGGLSDWYINEFGKPAFTIECGRGENPIPPQKYFQIYAGIREMLFLAPLLI